MGKTHFGHICFVLVTSSVATDHGEQAISSLKVGDHVLAYDPATTKIALKAIDAVLKHIDLSLEDLIIDGETIHTTPNHPFYTQDKGWVAADNLTVGESILKADGSYSKVQSVRLIDHAQVMYNVTVHDDHDYFVGIGQWLVHNFCPPTESGSGGWTLGPNDLDWRGTDKTWLDAIQEAMQRTGVPNDEFTVTKTGLTLEGKEIPVEYKASGPYRGAEVSMDLGHPVESLAPTAPHVGWQTPGKGGPSGHILLDWVPAGRPPKIKLPW